MLGLQSCHERFDNYSLKQLSRGGVILSIVLPDRIISGNMRSLSLIITLQMTTLRSQKLLPPASHVMQLLKRSVRWLTLPEIVVSGQLLAKPFVLQMPIQRVGFSYLSAVSEQFEQENVDQYGACVNLTILPQVITDKYGKIFAFSVEEYADKFYSLL